MCPDTSYLSPAPPAVQVSKFPGWCQKIPQITVILLQKETVNCNFFLIGLTITESGIIEPFLVRAHREVLIF